MKLDITEQMLFALLRSALHGTHADATIFAGITSEAWQECYRLSVRQGVMALAWDGLITLPTELQPPKSLKINWWLAVEDVKRDIGTIVGLYPIYRHFMPHTASLPCN